MTKDQFSLSVIHISRIHELIGKHHETINFVGPLTLLEIISSTGLQIKADPGVPIIYSGFFFLMISTLMSYVTYSQIWIIQKKQKLFIGGTTNRAIFDFELEFFKFIK